MAEKGRFLGLDLGQPINRRKVIKRALQAGVGLTALSFFGGALSGCGQTEEEERTEKVGQIEKIFKEKGLPGKHLITGDIKRDHDAGGNPLIVFDWELKSPDNKEGETTSKTTRVRKESVRINFTENDNVEPFVVFNFDPEKFYLNNYGSNSPIDDADKPATYFVEKNLEHESIIVTMSRSRARDFSIYKPQGNP